MAEIFWGIIFFKSQSEDSFSKSDLKYRNLKRQRMINLTNFKIKTILSQTKQNTNSKVIPVKF